MRQQVLKQQTTFSTVFITLGYLGFAAVLFSHIFDRFPKLKNALLKINCCKKRSDKRVKKSQNVRTNIEPPATQSGSVEDSTEQWPSQVTFTELREPLLEWERSVEVSSHPAEA